MLSQSSTPFIVGIGIFVTVVKALVGLWSLGFHCGCQFFIIVGVLISVGGLIIVGVLIGISGLIVIKGFSGCGHMAEGMGAVNQWLGGLADGTCLDTLAMGSE